MGRFSVGENINNKITSRILDVSTRRSEEGEKFNTSKMNEMTVEKVNELLDWTYEKTLNGVPKMDTAYELAEEYIQ